MKSVPRNVLLTFGLAVTALLLIANLNNDLFKGQSGEISNVSTAPEITQQAEVAVQAATTAPGRPVLSLDEQWKVLTTDVQKNGWVTVDLFLNAPGWDSVINENETFVSGSSTMKSQKFADLLTLSEQARSQLLNELTSYRFTILGGTGTYVPGIILRVDQPTLYYLKTLPLVQAISGGGPYTMPEN